MIVSQDERETHANFSLSGYELDTSLNIPQPTSALEPSSRSRGQAAQGRGLLLGLDIRCLCDGTAILAGEYLAANQSTFILKPFTVANRGN